MIILFIFFGVLTLSHASNNHRNIERLNDKEKLIKVKIPDFRSMIDVVLIDNDYNGKLFNINHTDVPEKKKDSVEGKYEIEIPKKKTTIDVKIIDMLGEEVLITKEI